MRVVCMVPSLTETLIEAGVKVVGRTRFCIHPEARVKGIPVVGGTKDANWNRVRDLKPDLILFDQEENTRQMAEECGLPFVATHVTNLETLKAELARLGQILRNEELNEYSRRLNKVMQLGSQTLSLPTIKVFQALPDKIDHVLYLIWKDPWMAVSRDTFIGSVLEFLGYELPQFKTKYPQINLADYSRENTALLFSSEPYPFAKFEDRIYELNFPSALVDGECYSWFGIRSIRFLETCVKLRS